jgi:uncharacterized protein (DUF1786 family)
VRATVEEDRPLAREHRDHGHVDVGDRRHDERVLGSQQRGQPLLDLLVQDRAADETRPARVRAPARQVLRHGGDDLLVEVEAQVVAGGEVREPLVADANVAPLLLVDHGIAHAV